MLLSLLMASAALPLDLNDCLNAKCPFSGDPVVASSLASYDGRTVGFCNPACRDKFEADPDAWPEAKGYFSALMREGQKPAQPNVWHMPHDKSVDALKESVYAGLMRAGTFSVGIYAPKGRDGQKPHAEDEIYIVEKGKGTFVRDDEKISFGPGDVIFVPKEMDHRFEDFSDDFRTWVVFFR